MTVRPLTTCCVTGKVAGHPDSCCDCDACLSPHHPPGVFGLIREIEHWRNLYCSAMGDNDEMKAALERLSDPARYDETVTRYARAALDTVREGV